MAKDQDPDPEAAAVFNAIPSAYSRRISKILIEILQQSPEHIESVKRKLLLSAGLLKSICSKSICDIVPEDVNRIIESVQSELSEAEANDVAASGRKRKRVSTRQRYEICENCEKEYDVPLNRNDSCGYHSDSYYWKEA